MFNTHAIIALNRVWAVLHPVSYRQLHRRRLALTACTILWIYALAANVTFIMLDSAYYRKHPATENGCYTANSDQQSYTTFLQIAFFVGPEMVVWLALPTLLIARWKRHRRRKQAIGPAHGTGRLDIVMPHCGPGNAGRRCGAVIDVTRSGRDAGQGIL